MDDATFGGGLNTTAAPPAAPQGEGGGFGSFMKSLGFGTGYTAPDQNASPLDQSADLLQQRVKRAGEIATNPIAQIFAPEQVQAARDFVPKAAEQLQTIQKQKADIAAGRQHGQNLGLDPGEVSDYATREDRVIAAQSRALKGDLTAFQGLQAYDPKAAEAIQDQVHSAVAQHLTSAQDAFEKLSNARNQGEYVAALKEIRKGGTIDGLESLGLKIPDTFGAFNTVKGREAEAIRNARIGVDTIRQKLEDRNTYQPMEEKEAKTYAGRMTTALGDQITNGTWSRNSAAGTRGLIVNGADDPRNLGKTFTFASPEQRKAIKEEFDGAVPKEDMEKYRAFGRTMTIAEPTAEQRKRGDVINTSPQAQQGIAEGLASMLRGGSGGANVGLLRLETIKTGAVQNFLDGLKASHAGALNTISGKDVSAYLTKISQAQRRAVLDDVKQYNESTISDRVAQIAKRAGALGLDSAAFGFGKNESAGAIGSALEEGRQAQIERMTPFHQAIGRGDGVFQIGAQRPGAGATGTPAGTQPATQLPGAAPLQTPVQQATGGSPNAPSPAPGAPNSTPPGGMPPGSAGSPATGGPGGGPIPLPAPRPPGLGGGGTPAGGPGGSPVIPPTSGSNPGRTGLPPGMTLDSPAALDAAANRTIQIESGFKPRQQTGRYVGLGQWSAEEMKRHGITDPDSLEQTRTALKADIQTRAAKLQKDGLPVTAANVYLMHQQGEAGLEAHLRNPDKPAWESVRFGYKNDAIAKRAIWGNMTGEMKRQMDVRSIDDIGKVTSGDFTRLWEARYNGTDIRTAGAAKGTEAAAERGPLATNLRNMPRYVEGTRRNVAEDQTTWPEVGHAAIEHAPAIGSTIGAIGGTLAAPGAGTIVGGGAGGAAGQSLKDYLQGREQSATRIVKEGALGAVLGVAGPEGRPIVGAAARALGAGGVEGAGKAVEGGNPDEIAAAALKGTANAALGEGFGRALGMGLHKLYSMFTPEAQKAVRAAASDLHTANETLKTAEPGTPGYDTAKTAKDAAETRIKELLPNSKPEEVAYAHKVTSEGVPKQEAQVKRPGELEKERIGAGYRQIEKDVGATGVGAPKAAPKLADGPIAAVENKQVSAKHAELAQRTEAVITAPAKNWQDKWVQLKDARSALLDAERDAMTSTATGRTQTAKDMRTLADTVRTQQEKAAKYVFGDKEGAAVIGRLKVLDKRYAILMDATNGGKLEEAARLKGEAGRNADHAFRAMAQNDPEAVRVWNSMRRSAGTNTDTDIRSQIGLEGLPVVGKYVSFGIALTRWMQDRVAGSTARFRDFAPELRHADWMRQNVAGSIGARAGVSADLAGKALDFATQ